MGENCRKCLRRCGNFNPELANSQTTCGGLAVVPVVFSDGTTKIFYPKFDSDGNYKVTSTDITSLLS